MLASAAGKVLEVGVFHNILKGYTSDSYSPDTLEVGALIYDQRRLLSVIDHCYGRVNRRMLSELLSGDRFLNMLR